MEAPLAVLGGCCCPEAAGKAPLGSSFAVKLEINYQQPLTLRAQAQRAAGCLPVEGMIHGRAANRSPTIPWGCTHRRGFLTATHTHFSLWHPWTLVFLLPHTKYTDWPHIPGRAGIQLLSLLQSN